MFDEKPPKYGLDARFESRIEKTGFVLQDDMLWAILEDKRFTVKDPGSWWPADFNNKGDVSITRRPRGRPAMYEENGLTFRHPQYPTNTFAYQSTSSTSLLLSSLLIY